MPVDILQNKKNLQWNFMYAIWDASCICSSAQLSLHDAPIFRLLLKIAVF